MITEDQIITLLSAEYINAYKVKLSFNDNTSQIVDFFPFLHNSLNPLIRKYIKIDEFKKFNIDGGDLEWNNYDLCFPIADLYENNIKP